MDNFHLWKNSHKLRSGGNDTNSVQLQCTTCKKRAVFELTIQKLM